MPVNETNIIDHIRNQTRTTEVVAYINEYDVSQIPNILHAAIKDGDSAVWKALLDKQEIKTNKKLNELDKKGKPPLYYAIEWYPANRFKALINAGADIDVKVAGKSIRQHINQYIRDLLDPDDQNKEELKSAIDKLHYIEWNRRKKRLIRTAQEPKILSFSITNKAAAYKFDQQESTQAILDYFRVTKNEKKGRSAEYLSANLFTGNKVMLDGYSARSVIIAIVLKMCRLLAKKPNAFKNANGSEDFFTAKFSLGGTVFSCVLKPMAYQKGNLYLNIDSNSSDLFLNGQKITSYQNKEYFSYGQDFMIKFIDRITNKDPEREKQLAKLLIEKSQVLAGFDEDDFNSQGLIRLDSEAKLKNLNQNQETLIHLLNHLIILWFILESSRRLLRDANGNIYSNFGQVNNPENAQNVQRLDGLQVATLQADSLYLVINGHASLNDIFGTVNPANIDNAKLGVVTGKGLSNKARVDSAEKKAKKVVYLRQKNSAGTNLGAKGLFAHTKKGAYQSLISTYGDGSESSSNELEQLAIEMEKLAAKKVKNG